MNKPEDISQEAWDAAVARWNHGRGIADIARAIMHAEKAEQQRCTAILVGMIKRHGEPGAVAENPYVNMYDALSAIRKRCTP